jgi:hypothetical protein
MTDVAVDTLRLRGPHARRLAAVAARALPAALERAMAGVGDVRLDRVEVSLDLDPADYDDETLAILWADAIRARVLATTPSPRPPTRLAPSVTAAAPVRTPAPAEVLAEVRDWLAAAGRPPLRRPSILPAAVVALGDPVVARAVRAVAGPGEWARLLAALDNALRTTETVAPEGEDPPLTVESEVTEPAAPAPVAPSGPVAGAAGAWVPARGERVAVLDMLAALAELTAAHAGPADPATVAATVTPAVGVDLATVTRSAGLVLLYPWLADHCRQAQALHPDLDGLDVREAALAAIVDPADPTLADDPLVGLLAGRLDAPVERRVRVELDRQDEVAASGARVLASFAVLLPGFGNSTGMFVRDSWIRRLGVVHRDRDPALLVAATHPLDVVLPLLPYPFGLVKLPWSPPLSVRFAP